LERFTGQFLARARGTGAVIVEPGFAGQAGRHHSHPA
jgi:hypothetical protein